MNNVIGVIVCGAVDACVADVTPVGAIVAAWVACVLLPLNDPTASQPAIPINRNPKARTLSHLIITIPFRKENKIHKNANAPPAASAARGARFAPPLHTALAQGR